MSLLFISSLISCKTQVKEIKATNNFTLKSLHMNNKIPQDSFISDIRKDSKSGNSYNFMKLRGAIGALNVVIKDKKEPFFINLQQDLIDNIINSSEKSSSIKNNLSYNDNYQGWVSLKRNGTFNNEVILYESYSFLYITEFLYYLKDSMWILKSKKNEKWYLETLSFIEKNIWSKWRERGLKTYGKDLSIFLRGRTHMGSHWAGIAFYLSKLSTNPTIKKQCKNLVNEYDILLKRNLRPNPQKPTAYIWNSTYDNVKGTQAIKTEPSIIQDVSHANHVITYLVIAHELGSSNWDRTEVNKLCNTFKYIIYDNRNKSFSDNVDGSQDSKRPNWGNFLGDGWVKLVKYDSKILKIINDAIINNSTFKKYNSGIQLKANLNFYSKQNK